MKEIIKKNIFVNIISILVGYLYFLVSSKTLHYSKMSLISLYCKSNGRLNDWIQKLIVIFQFSEGELINNNHSSILSEDEITIATETLRKEGYYVFQKKLDENLINTLVNFTKSRKAWTTKGDFEYDFNNPKSILYRYYPNELLQNETIFKLIFDKNIYKIAKGYFKSNPIFNNVALWWSTIIEKDEVHDAAQAFHFDYDGIKTLKLFVYLTDVEDENGPHVYIKKTHLSNKKPSELLKKNYVRIEDNEVFKYYDKSELTKIKGKKGTIILGDTSCFHKGQKLEKGNRLVFDIQFTSAIFGSANENYSIKKELYNKRLISKNKKFTQKIRII